MSTTLERVKKVVADKLQRSEDEIAEDASFKEDLGADSLEMVELALGFEDEFDVQIPDEDADNIQTVGQAVEYLNGRIVG